ncbi:MULTISPECIES: type II secretion system F family protein [unclassified Arthrobacter]|uniref:type II secretion system F family protein n=1 Tax=unclassified Arthrobacter TaxID=235627 RepID=UPI001D1557DC|nr:MULTISPECIES: type II secretion system F family protein [unclassified Arthrobacter]MCC3276860.1 type II secretion system F family protein [Arthrobacter sp. zg-Y20]MCC9176112.1 type II secretion system F family protein [Arthrobacter sp. zg-Y750]MDK1317021.1 type II secretion system F family protein [Arthrobacter sp. zg.Y20]WIB05267.1 type II secretion system F family protein [Arthrobacter sp. zg-Y20]
MSAAAGLCLGLGLLLLWQSCWNRGPAPARRRTARVEELLRQAGIERVSAAGLLATCAGTGALVLAGFFIVTLSLPIAACFGLFGAGLPYTLVRMQARRRRASLAELWPDVVDHLRSAIRAGLPLPEALIQLADNGPGELRGYFRAFAADYRSAGDFEDALNRLKDALADPVADRIVEALRITRQVGGTDLGRLLGTLAGFLRENARTRSELLARQSWTVNAARLAVAAPWAVLLLLAARPETAAAYNTGAGAAVLAAGMAVSILCYRLMLRIGALPEDVRVLR